MLHVVNMPLQACYSWFIAVIANHLLLRYHFSPSACMLLYIRTFVYSSIRARCDRVGETLLDTKNCCAKVWPCLVHVHCVTTYPSCPLLRWAHYYHIWVDYIIEMPIFENPKLLHFWIFMDLKFVTLISHFWMTMDAKIFFGLLILWAIYLWCL